MALEQRQFAIAKVAVLLLLLLASASSAAPTSRRIIVKTGKEQSFHSLHQDEESVVKMEGRMGIEVADYPGTGANKNHDPKTPGTL